MPDQSGCEVASSKIEIPRSPLSPEVAFALLVTVLGESDAAMRTNVAAFGSSDLLWLEKHMDEAGRYIARVLCDSVTYPDSAKEPLCAHVREVQRKRDGALRQCLFDRAKQLDAEMAALKNQVGMIPKSEREISYEFGLVLAAAATSSAQLAAVVDALTPAEAGIMYQVLSELARTREDVLAKLRIHPVLDGRLAPEYCDTDAVLTELLRKAREGADSEAAHGA